MRILGESILFHLAILLALMVSLIYGNLYLIIDKAHPIRSLWFYAGSIFLLGALAMQFIINAIISLDFENLIVFARNWFFLLSILSFAAFFVLTRASRKGFEEAASYSQMADIFTQAEDTVIIFSVDGSVLRIQDKHQLLMAIDHPISHVSQFFRFMPLENNDLEKTCLFEIGSAETEFVYQVTLSPIRNETKQIIGYTAVIFDITHHKKLMIALAEKNSQLKEHNIKLLQEVELSDQLQLENKRLEIITEIQDELVGRIDSAILAMEQMELEAEGNVHPKTEEIQRLSHELNNLYGRVREVVKTIAPAKGEMNA